MILTGVQWLGLRVHPIDPIKFNQTRQLACSRALRFSDFDHKIIFFFRSVFTGHMFKLCSD